MSVSSDSALSEHAPTTGEASAPRGQDLPARGTRRHAAPGVPRIDPTDGELLSLFTRHDDRDALDRLIDRHAPMVWRVCRQSLRRQQDAEDAFQATFLLLIKSAKSIRSSDSAAGWLYRVAYRTSIRARKQLAARREESLAVDPDAPSEKAFPDLLRKQTTGVLVEELMRLPAKYQTALVLRYLEGQSRRAIADQTDTTVAAVQGRLARGKQLLRRRLLRRGVSLSAAMAALGLAGRGAQAAETAPAHVVAQTTTNGVALATGGSLAASAAVVSLYQEGVRAMLLIWIAKPAGVAASLAAVALLAMAPGAGGETPSATPSAVLQLAVDLPSDRESSTPEVELTERITLAQANTSRDEARYTETHSVAKLIEAMRVLEPEASEKQILSSLANRLRQEVLDDSDEVGIFAANQSLVITGNGDKQEQVAELLAKVRTAGNEPTDPDLFAQKQVLAALRRPLPEGGFDFPEGTPLIEVLDYLAAEFDIDVDIDGPALDDYGLGRDEPVSIHRRHGTIGAALEQMLGPLELRAIAHNGVLRVTTAVRAAKQLEVQVYSVADLLDANGIDAEQLAQTVTKMVEPGTWAENGGQAELTLMSGGVLTVSQSQRGHERLVELLNSLREVSAAISDKTARTQSAPTLQAPTVTVQPGATGVVRMTAPYDGGLTATTTPQSDGSAELRVLTTEAMPKAEPLGMSLRPPVPDGPGVKYAERNSEYGWSVNQLQERLNESLDPSPNLQSDGDYGPKTTAAVKRFQKEKGLPETGFADQVTRASLGFVTQGQAAHAVQTTSTRVEGSPRVVESVPARGATNVDPALKEIRVTFDRDMRPNGYSFTGMPKPDDGRKPRWIDKRTCVLPVKLQPGQDYWVGINADGRTSFKSADGTPATFDELQFTTASENYQYGPDSTMKQGQWNCLHRITELNPAGWATVAELKVGDHAPIKLPDDKRPRPHVRLEAVENGAARFTIVDPGFPEDGEAWDTSQPRSIRDVPVETFLLSEGEREGSHLLVIRQQIGSAVPVQVPTVEAAQRLLHENRRSQAAAVSHPDGPTFDSSGLIRQVEGHKRQHAAARRAGGATQIEKQRRAIEVLEQALATVDEAAPRSPADTDLIAAMEADLDKAERHLRNAEKLAATVFDLARADRGAGASGPRLVTKAFIRRALTGLAPAEKLRSDVGNRLTAWVEGQMEAEEPLDEIQSESETIAARLEVLGKQAGDLKRRIRNPFHILDEAGDFPPGNWTAGHDGDLQDFNNGGWTALAELRLNQTAPLPATEGADPRPRIRLLQKSDGIAQVGVIDPGGKMDRASIRLSETAHFIETRAGLVAIQHLPDAKSEQKGTALFILRAVSRKSAKLRDITAEQVRSALYKKPSKSVSTGDASRRRESSEEPTGTTPPTGVEGSPTEPGPQPVAKVSANRVDHTDGKADGKKSLGGSGHLIRFELPEGAAGVKAVRIHGSRYGTKAAPREDFEVSFLSEDRTEILAVERAAYGLFRRGAEKWTTIRFKAPVVDLPETFWVAIDFAPGRTKGVYLSYDTSTKGERSMTGLAQQEPNEHQPVTFEGDWMVSLVLERADRAAADGAKAESVAETDKAPSGDLDALNAQAWRHFFANDQPAAEKLFRQILAADANHLAACNGLGFCLINRGEHEEALPLFEKCLAANPKAAGPLNGLGRTLEAAGDLDGAIAAWERGVAAMPNQLGAAHMALARVYSERKLWEKALPLLEQVVADQPEAEPFADWLKAAKRALNPGPPKRLTGDGVYVVGTYSGADGGPLTVEVPATEEPITLLLCAYYWQDWKLKLDPAAKLERVIVAGYNGQRLDGVIEALPEGVPLDVFSYYETKLARNDTPRPESFGEREFFYAYKQTSEEYHDLVDKVRELTGKEIAHFQGATRADSFVVGRD